MNARKEKKTKQKGTDLLISTVNQILTKIFKTKAITT